MRIGCAGWSLPKEHADHFPGEGTHLERYAARFPGVEINTSFYRPHRPDTYARWADSTPETFRFSVKAPRVVTHERRLVDVADELDRFLGEVANLGDRLGPILVQLPPSQKFVEKAETFFSLLRERFAGEVACEPRHATWFDAAAEQLLTKHRVSRVAADPAVLPAAAEPGGWQGLVYYRLHGSPRMYYSPYSRDRLQSLALRLIELARTASVWCIFDNTAEGEATANALELLNLVKPSP